MSMRDIAAQAGVGLPLIVYHFETKQNLYRALFERFRTLLDARLTALHAPVAPGVTRWSTSSARWFCQWCRRRAGRPAAYAKLVAREVSDPREAERGIVAEYFDPFAVEFVHAIRTVLPRQDPDYAHWAYLYAVGALVMSVFDRRIERISEGQTHAGDLKNKAEYLVRFIVAGMRAGSSEPDLAGAGQEEEGHGPCRSVQAAFGKRCRVVACDGEVIRLDAPSNRGHEQRRAGGQHRATTILNQVTAPNPSQLMGTMEVAGTPT